MGDWSMLNDDLLGEIALSIDAIEDFVYFSIVCSSWNHASSLVKRKWKASMPYLLLAENLEDNPNFLRKLFSLDNNKCYNLSLPQSFGSRCWGSSCGWVVTIDLNRQIRMLNPFTKASFELPSQRTFPYQEAPLDNAEEDDICKRVASIRKAIVVKSGDESDDDLIVLAINTNWKRFLAFARPGDQTWTSIVPPWPLVQTNTPCKIPFSHRAVDIVCHDRLILILYEDASVGYLDMSDFSKNTNLQKSVKAKEFLPSLETLKGRLKEYLLEMYLVESFGDLLVVLRHRNDVWVANSQVDKDNYYETVGFSVFGFNYEIKKWEQVKELGDVALFVGDSHSISVRASGCQNCKSNCVYFTDDYTEHWDQPAKLGGHDMGVFNLENGEIHKFYDGDDLHSDFCTPFWFMPQF